jgi:ketosteroid isomerase-like protein
MIDTPHHHADLITRFYTAFAARDAEAMAACYHSDCMFMDPVFGRLNHDEVCAMWRMLNGRSKDLGITFEKVEADEGSGSAHWEATYTFSKTGRNVHNKIDAQFGFLEGLILAHRDRFNFYAWTRQALGVPGVLLGWSPIIQNKVRREARKSLDVYMASKP